MRGTRRRLFVAPLTGFFVFLTATCALAPLGAVGAALERALCPIATATETENCGSSCPREQTPRPSNDSDCKGCGAQGGFLVEKRRAPVAAPALAFAVDDAAPVAVFQAAAAVRLVALTASPPIHLLHATFRN